jgi:pimeloyl-ACP methyl ester carboxylesterase
LLIVGTPQNWNAYAYCHNNPLNKLDPDGFLTIVIPGTWNDRKKWKQSEFVREVSKTFGEDAIVLRNNNMGNSKQARSAAAKQLEEIVKNHEFAPGEKLNIVAHSHGGNVAMQATQEGLAHKVDNLVTLGTPIRPDYNPNQEMIGSQIQVYSNHDEIQPHGGPGPAVLGPLAALTNEMGPAKRTLDLAGVKNLDASEHANGHSDLWQNTSTWTKVVAPEIKK